MSRSTSIAAVAAGSCAILLLGLGGYLVASRQLRSAMAEESRRQDEAGTLLRENGRALREQIQQLSTAQETLVAAAGEEPEYMPRLRALTNLISRVNEGASTGRAVLPALTMSGEIGELLGLTQVEVDGLLGAASETVTEAATLAFSHTTVIPRDRQLFISVDAFAMADQTKVLLANMRDRFMTILGPQRYEIVTGMGYVSAVTKELENSGFGASEIQYVITRQPDPADGSPPRPGPARYQLQKRVTNLQGRVSNSGQTSDLRTIRETIGLAGLLVPSDL